MGPIQELPCVYLQAAKRRTTAQKLATNEEDEDKAENRHRLEGGFKRRRGRRRGAGRSSEASSTEVSPDCHKVAWFFDQEQTSCRHQQAKPSKANSTTLSGLTLMLLVASTFQGTFICNATKTTSESSSSRTDAANWREEASHFVRSSAATARNLQLLDQLESAAAAAASTDYQLCYPQLLEEDSLEPAQPNAAAADPSQREWTPGGRLQSRRQTSLRQSSVVQGASDWLQHQQHQQHQQQHQQPAASVAAAAGQTSGGSTMAPAATGKLQQTKTNQVLGHYNRTNVVIKAFNYKLRLDLELNNGIIHVDNESFVIHPLFDADLSKKHPHIIYRYQTSFNQPAAEQSDGSRDRQQQQQPQIVRQCGNARLHQWALRQYSNSDAGSGGGGNGSIGAAGAKLAGQRQRFRRHDDRKSAANSSAANYDNCDNHDKTPGSSVCETTDGRGREAAGAYRRAKRDVSLTEKYIELALILSQDMFDKRNTSSRLDVLHDSIQIVNCLDLYFRYSANTRVALIYLETWAHGDQIDLAASNDVKQTLYQFLEYTTRKLYQVNPDAAHLLVGGHARQFDANEVGMAMPDSICSPSAVSVSQEPASTFEPFIAAATMAHMLGHNLGMEHDDRGEQDQGGASPDAPARSQPPMESAAELFRDPPPPSEDPLGLTIRKPLLPSAGRDAAKDGGKIPEMGEEHEDEIRSRSLGGNYEYGGSSQQHYRDHEDARQGPGMGGSSGRFITGLEHNDQWCSGSGCLMSASFAFVQAPVSFGNMIQQQVAAAPERGAGTGANGSMMFSGDQATAGAEPAASVLEPTHTSLQQQQQQQQLPFRFSRRSIDTYHRMLRAHRGLCLFNKPGQVEDFRTCGNGIVDRGEDCDCGTFRECEEMGDTCCDPITCRFKADAQCINGACCDRCRLRPKGLVCRRARGECDLPEVCDGKSGQCAPDVHKQNGYPCANNTGFCYLGQCPSHDQQCTDLWGSEARKSHRYCYSNFNSNGTGWGNCGQDQAGSSSNKKYRRCEQENVMCGTLQCQMGEMKPLLTSAHAGSLAAGAPSSPENTQQQVEQYSKKTIQSLDGRYHECKTIIAGQSSYVRDGSKCAPDRVCSNQTCQPVEKVYRDSFELCPRDERGQQCSGNGICSTAHRCHCDPGWMGHDCSQKLANSPVLLAADLPLDQLQQQQHQVKPSSLTNLPEPINETEMPPLATTMRPLISPIGGLAPITTQTSLPLVLGVAAPNVTVAPTTEAATTLAAVVVSTTPVPPPVQSPSTVVLDKKKHDALGAPTLVFILVSIVAAVYVGFALMANCYRRKGFIKPDKVLRHHQMNCKLDALRSSFIAKRLADAATVGSFDQQSGSMSLMQPGSAALLAQSEHLDAAGGSANLFAQAPASAQFAMQEPMPMQPPYDDSRGPQSRGFLPSAFRRYPFSGLRNAPTAPVGSNSKPPQTTAAQVHYFDSGWQPLQQHQPHQHHLHHNQHSQRQQQRFDYPMEPTGSCDHTPLLMASSAGHQQQHQHQHHHHHQQQHQQMDMRSFKQPGQGVVLSQQTSYGRMDPAAAARGRSISRQTSKFSMNNGANDGSNINRATSLGSVSARQDPWQQHHQSSTMMHGAGPEDDEEAPGTAASTARRYAHKALATPVRTRRTHYHQHHRHHQAAPPDDSCSAVSSPDHGFGRDWTAKQHQSSFAAGENSAPRSRPSTGYHEDLLLGGGGGDDDDLDELPLTPPPPPPLLPHSSSAAGEMTPIARRADDDLMTTTEEESTELSTVIQQRQRQHHQQQQLAKPESGAKSSPVWMRQRVKRIPLNNTGQDDRDDEARGEAELEVGDEQLSLLAQLQQLEQVQSLHQRQVANHKPASEAGTLHEFFSLPLSVQLSALLARSLTGPANQSGWQTTPIDEYLNTLNSSNVANASRRSFKKQPDANKQQSSIAAGSSGSRGGTMKRQQQIKLQNLQGLINRLQKLHQQQRRRQDNHDEYDDGGLDDGEFLHTESVYEPGSSATPQSRQSTLGRRRSASRNGGRQMTTVDDMQANSLTTAVANRRRAQRRSISRRSPDNRNESVYSMSDSEDGPTYASRVFNPNLRQQQLGRNEATTPSPGQANLRVADAQKQPSDSAASASPADTNSLSPSPNPSQPDQSNKVPQANKQDEQTNNDLDGTNASATKTEC